MFRRNLGVSKFVGLVCLAAALTALLVLPSVALAAKKNATLVHVGPAGLMSYNAWTKKSATLVDGMQGTWYYPVFSPNGISVITMKNNRTDRAYSSEIYGAVVASTTPFELTYDRPEGGIGMTSFLGWLDDYQAVFQQDDPNNPDEQATIVRDVRDPSSGSYYDGAVTYPSSGRKTTHGDRTYTVKVSSKQWISIRSRKTKKRVAHFKLPGSGNGRSATGWYYADASISPDGKFIAYELWRTPTPSSYVTWRTYVCTLKGKSARRLSNADGGFVWK